MFELSPGAAPLPDDIATQAAALAARRAPRTRHAYPDGRPRFANRLCLESSPYLLQHAHNPVDWRAWNEDSLRHAQTLGRPVFLSIGYSTCHWCHVMEEESFEDLEIAALLNSSFVPIKVDREERPDVDAVYMRAVHMLSGGGGWPLTVLLTPDGRPFWGGTYFPAHDGDRGVGMGLSTILGRVAQLWETEPERLRASSTSLAEAVTASLSVSGSRAALGADIPRAAVRFFTRHFDPVHGGLAGAPKFPSSLPVGLLLRLARRTEDAGLVAMVRKTLLRMADGGIRDQLGGGFHRYATDDAWLVPHFEKMLYDNALLVLAYLDGYLALGEERFAEVARGILDDMIRDMRDPAGGFHAATDADSRTPDGRVQEGWFFTWTLDEMAACLTPDQVRLAAAWHGVTARGNFEGRNILTHPSRPESVARALGLGLDELRTEMGVIDRALRACRATRPAPHRDDKVIASWNGLMLSALARASVVLKDVRYLDCAVQTAEFLVSTLVRDGRLYRSWCHGVLGPAGFLSDHAMLAAGMLDVHEATQDDVWLEWAETLAGDMIRLFGDDSGGFFRAAADQDDLFTRDKPVEDGALPSGNSAAALLLLRLAGLTGKEFYHDLAEKTLRMVLGGGDPAGHADMLLALDWYLDRPWSIVIAVSPGRRDEAWPLLNLIHSLYLPNHTLRVVEESSEAWARMGPAAPRTVRGLPTAHVCEKGVCHPPVTDIETLRTLLARVTPLP